MELSGQCGLVLVVGSTITWVFRRWIGGVVVAVPTAVVVVTIRGCGGVRCFAQCFRVRFSVSWGWA